VWAWKYRTPYNDVTRIQEMFPHARVAYWWITSVSPRPEDEEFLRQADKLVWELSRSKYPVRRSVVFISWGTLAGVLLKQAC
jgi:hypothetical protein